ncbi:hypothetical protein [Sulfuricurvum sp.]|uniref:hypothetical protein n=1 Tax=Sulfuricurvum sp. TaxID=2025608 RepID=UPI001982F6F4|nr:hypothetical protein [Sulfuricurvum sp.]MBD3799342.1 hypothetical protein [Campylobacterota bacterium]MBD3806336.1 hypothetical protein [Sulfuricurvum sp.]
MKKRFFLAIATLLMFTGCSATWNGAQQDISNAIQWTKSQVNKGASYVKEKTE